MKERRKLAAKWNGVLVPMVDRYVKELSKNFGGWHIRRFDNRIAVCIREKFLTWWLGLAYVGSDS